jgi:hypothetical protein
MRGHPPVDMEGALSASAHSEVVAPRAGRGGTTSSNPLCSSGESANSRSQHVAEAPYSCLTMAVGSWRLLTTDYPTRQSGLASRRRDNRRLRSQEPRPSKSAPARYKNPRSRIGGFVSSRPPPLPHSTVGRGRALAGRRSLRSARRNHRRPIRARYLRPDPDRLAACPNPVRRRARPSVWWLREPRPEPTQQRAFQVSDRAAVSRAGLITG